MTTIASKEQLITAVEQAVADTLTYFAGPGQTTSARIDQWGAWEVLAHLPYWHYATTWAIHSAQRGGPPWLLSGSADEINAACLPLHAGEGFDDLIERLRRAQARLVRAAGTVTDLEAPAFRFTDGRIVTIRQRLETIARHWNGHLNALKDASR